MRTWLLLVMVGCYDPKAAAGVPCGAGDVCPSGFACYGGRCLAEPPPFDAGIDSPPIDAAPLTCSGIPEGGDCDDRNICTSESKCRSGMCVASMPASACTVADSQDEFSGTQGTDGWWYGNWFAATDGDGMYGLADFGPASFISGAWRTPDHATNFSWAYTAAFGGHPDDSPRVLPIRRWISDVQGTARIAILHRKSDTGGGDGTRAILIIDGVQVWMHDVAGTDGVGSTSQVDVELAIGTKVDFLLDPLIDDGNDTTDHRMTIRSQ